MREYYNQQMKEKRQREEEERMLNIKQAEVWKQDKVNYENHEKNKNDYIKSVNIQHADILKH